MLCIKLLSIYCQLLRQPSQPVNHPESRVPVWVHYYTIICHLAVTLALTLSGGICSRPLFRLVILTIRVSCVIGSSTLHLINYTWLHHNSLSSLGLHPSPLWWHYHSWHSLSTFPILSLPVPWKASVLCDYSSSSTISPLLHKQCLPILQRAQACQPLLPTAPSTSSHSQVPDLQFLEWGDIFSCFSSSNEELRSLKFILKQQVLWRDVKQHQLSQSWQKWGKVGG